MSHLQLPSQIVFRTPGQETFCLQKASAKAHTESYFRMCQTNPDSIQEVCTLPQNLSQAHVTLELNETNWDEGHHFRWMVSSSQRPSEVLGLVSLCTPSFSKAIGHYYLSYFMDQAMRRRGIAEAACKSVLQQPNLEPIDIHAMARQGNAASQKLLLKLGFTPYPTKAAPGEYVYFKRQSALFESMLAYFDTQQVA